VNLALLSSGIAGSAPAGVHFVVASLFALPFERASFDLVYSQGVLHHTFSTREAFAAVAPLAREGGRLFVWLYGVEDRLVARGRRGAGMRVGVTAERALRPVLSRAPARVRAAFFRGASAVAHPVLRPRMRHADVWSRADTDTFLRDWLSPPFAHRHGWNEVIGWFEEHGFDVVSVQSPTRYRELFGEPLWGVGLTGRRTAA
jgi:SAM-dependent methyltransferase